MSGTASGTIVLHVTPEAAVGGPLGWCRTGDRIRLDAAGRRIDVLLIDERELAARAAADATRQPAKPSHARLPAPLHDRGPTGRRGLRLPLVRPRRGRFGALLSLAGAILIPVCIES